ncbi:MAG: Rad52/Rad22 family DNA repair protein [Candidatus Angelobacter sp.]
MTAINGHANASAASHPHRPNESASATAMLGVPTGLPLTPQKIKELVGELEVPFDPCVIEWRVTNTTKGNCNPRGQVIPYADQRAYTDRLNALFSPAGWTREYAVHTSANFQRGKDQRIVAKVFVTCNLTVFGLGLHSATGEEWADDENAGTSAEAQAFKRACSCFGLGRYLYYFSGTWVDLDDRKRPKTVPKLAGWATPEGWRQGQRPAPGVDRQSSKPAADVVTHNGSQNRQNEIARGEHTELIRQIEAMAEPLGRGIYRGLLKKVARVWKPSQIQESTLLEKILAQMQAAERGLSRLDAAVDKTGPYQLAAILRSMNLKSLDQVDNLETLQKIVVALEAKADLASRG